jgi:hypothetical protein
LESLGYPQDVIASFARPKSSTKFFGIPIIDFISLQREYQSFRDRFEALEKVRSAEDALVDGLSLSLRLERLGVKARNVLASPISNMHKSLAAVLAAIAYDYAGLIAMRCMRAKPHPSASDPSLDRALAQVLADIEGSSFVAGQEIRADRLFLASAGLAERAGLELDAAANQDEGDPTRREEYKQSLSQIVGWQDWALAPAENRLRLDRVPFDEKLSKFEELISKRMVRISLELAQPLGRKSFSAAGDAAQCAQRLGEVLRLVCGVRESGAPDRQKFAKGVAVDRIVDAAIKYSVECLTAGNETSSIPNFRFLSAYDALVLAALYRANDSDARDWIAKAREYVSRYAGDDKAFRGRLSNRLRQVESRLT